MAISHSEIQKLTLNSRLRDQVKETEAYCSYVVLHCSALSGWRRSKMKPVWDQSMYENIGTGKAAGKAETSVRLS